MGRAWGAVLGCLCLWPAPSPSSIISGVRVGGCTSAQEPSFPFVAVSLVGGQNKSISHDSMLPAR